jgi:acetyl esterase/lipase
MQTLRAALLAGLTALLSACSPFSAINLLVPKSGYDVHGALAYGADPRQKLDVYVPQGLKGPAPVLLFFYGGAWSSGNRGDYRAFGQAFASEGIVTVVADYRLYPQVNIPPSCRMPPRRWPMCMPMRRPMAAIRRASSSPAIRRAATMR